MLNFSPDHNGSLAGQLKEGEKQSGFIAQLSRSINLKQNCKGEECEKSGYKRKQELKKANALQSIHAILQNSATATGKVVGPGAPEPVIENRHLPTKCTDCSQKRAMANRMVLKLTLTCCAQLRWCHIFQCSLNALCKASRVACFKDKRLFVLQQAPTKGGMIRKDYN